MNSHHLKTILLLIASLVGAGSAAASESLPRVVVYKNPSCGCCEKWSDHMRKSGFKVDVQVVPDVTPVRRGLGLQDRFASCHTAWLQGTGYVVEGHVPADDVRKVLKDKPKALGVVVPGMPPSAPGMDLPVATPYDTLLVQRDGANQVFARH